MFKYLLLLCLTPYTLLAKSELTLSGKIHSDSVSQTKQLILKYDFDIKNKFHQEIDFNTKHSYLKSGNEYIKYRAFIDAESISKFNLDTNTYTSIYFRHKNDKYKNSSYQNYSIASIGYGGKEKYGNFFPHLEVFFGKRYASKKDISISRYALTLDYKLKAFRATTKYAFLKGKHFRDKNYSAILSYSLSKRVSIKYLAKLEQSRYNNVYTINRINTLALGFSF